MLIAYLTFFEMRLDIQKWLFYKRSYEKHLPFFNMKYTIKMVKLGCYFIK